MPPETTTAPATLRLTRRFAAPPERIFRAWTDPDLLARWWWPARFATTFALDLRPGGTYRIASAPLPERGPLVIVGTFRAVEPPARLVYTWRWEGLDSAESLVTVLFRPCGPHADQTEITLIHERLADPADAENHRLGWESCLGRLDEVVVSRES